jgi:cyclic 2,3-diphosphoglycerate synthetase
LRVIALIDGEHHASVARDALDRLAAEHDLCGVLFVGGEEKVAGAVLADAAAHYGREVAIAPDSPLAGLRELAVAARPDVVFDLSGEPVLDGDGRFGLASMALHLGLEYRTAGFFLSPPPQQPLPFHGPVIEVIGTGKRTGKTAVAGHYAALLRERALEPVIVSMGRGGPPEPQLVRADKRPDLSRLIEIARSGGHAASDYLEDAVLAGVSCVGCRRCGEGLAGEPFDSNVIEGATLALSLDPDVLLIEGSGASVPPILAHRSVCVTGATRARSEALSYLGPYRLLRSDLIAIVGADQVSPAELSELKRRFRAWCRDAMLVGCTLEPEPVGEVRAAKRAALFTTAPAEREQELRAGLARHGCEIRVFSPNLARRAKLERDLERAARERCDLFLTELKAAAIEVVAEEAERRQVPIAFIRNRPVSLPGEPELDAELERLLDEACAEAARAEPTTAGGARGEAR